MEGSRLAHFQQETAGTYHEYYLHQGRGICHGRKFFTAVDLDMGAICPQVWILNLEALQCFRAVTGGLPGHYLQEVEDRALVSRGIDPDTAAQECIDVFHG